MRIFLAFVLMVHGIAHLVGFVGNWNLDPQVPYKTTIFGGAIDLGPVGIRVLGALWLIVALAFMATAVAAYVRMAGWTTAVLVLSGVSLAMCFTALPEARIGIVVDVALLLVLLLWPRAALMAN